MAVVDISTTDKKYQIIYADPAWSYRDTCDAGKRGASHKYKVSTLSDMMQMPINRICDDDCVLFMWHVAPQPQEALDLLKAWGFKLKTFKAFTWIKLNKRFINSVHKAFGISPEEVKSMSEEQVIDLMQKLTFMGMGNWTRANSEDCLVAIKGKPKRISASIKQVIFAPIGEHSAKPPLVRDKIVELVGDLPRIELFARDCHCGWDSFGFEVEDEKK